MILARQPPNRKLIRYQIAKCAPVEVLLFAQDNFSDAAFDLEVNRGWRFPIRFVGVRITVLFQAVRANRANPAGSMRDHPNIFRQSDTGLADSAFDVRGQILRAVARQIDVYLAGAQRTRCSYSGLPSINRGTDQSCPFL